MKKISVLLVIALASFLVLVPLEASAIVRRHDKSDDLYQRLGAQYPAVGHFQERVGCTLIAPQWAITAAHVVEGNPPFVSYFVLFGGKRYDVEKIVIHPLRKRNAVDSSADIALLKLTKPVEGIAPVPLYDLSDEAGKKIVMVGRGRSGDGLTGASEDRGTLRGATNEIDGALENSLLVIFDAPPFGTELEGITGPGDSGSPAFIEKDGKSYIVGVASFNSGDPDKGTSSKYQTFTAYARISTRRDWVLNTIKQDPPDSNWGPRYKATISLMPRTVFGKRAAAFISAFNSGKESEIAAAYRTEVVPGTSGRTPEERAKAWRELMDQYGDYEVKGFSRLGNSHAFLVYSRKANIWRGIKFDFEPTAPNRITKIDMWDAEPPTGQRIR
jgi:hypothetical protein